MKEQEQESIEPLKYQLRQWRELVNKYLPPTDCDRDDVGAIEALIKKAGSNSALSDGLCAPWDYLENDPDDHFANYYAWEKWLQVKDTKDSLEDLDMMQKALLYALMVDLLKGN